MKLSFIIPAWNRATTICFCLDSILSQPDICDYEVIVIDDGSTDETVSFVETIIGRPKVQSLVDSSLAEKLPVLCHIFQEKGIEYEYRIRSRVRLLYQHGNTGAAAARN